MNKRLVYIDLLGYKYFEEKYGTPFIAEYKIFCERFLNLNEIKEIYHNCALYKANGNADGIFIISDRPYGETYGNFKNYLYMLSFCQVYPLYVKGYLYRGYATYFESSENYDEFVQSEEITSLVSDYFDKKQKVEDFPRIGFNYFAADSNFVTKAFNERILGRKKQNYTEFHYFLNPFAIFLYKGTFTTSHQKTNDFRDKVYRELRDKVEKLLNTYRHKDPYRKYIWLAYQFDKFVIENNLPFEPIIKFDDIRYVAFSDFDELKSFQMLLNFRDKLLQIYNIKTGKNVEDLIKTLKLKSRKVYTYERTKKILIERKLKRIPRNTYDIISNVILECEKANCFKNKEEVTKFQEMFDRCYVNILEDIHDQNPTLFAGYVLESERLQYLHLGEEDRLFRYQNKATCEAYKKKKQS